MSQEQVVTLAMAGLRLLGSHHGQEILRAGGPVSLLHFAFASVGVPLARLPLGPVAVLIGMLGEIEQGLARTDRPRHLS